MSVTLQNAVQIHTRNLGSHGSDSRNTSSLCARPPRSWSWNQKKAPLRCLHTCFKNDEDKHRSRSRVIVRCEMAPKGRGSSEPSPGHDEQHQQHCKYTKRDHAHNPDEQPHEKKPHEKKSCHKKAEEVVPELRPGGEWHDIFHSELREWKGMKSSKIDEQCDNDPYPEYAPRQNDEYENDRPCSALKESDKGYVIKVSKELMGLFCYIEKRKRSMIKELAHTLRQVHLHQLQFLQFMQLLTKHSIW